MPLELFIAWRYLRVRGRSRFVSLIAGIAVAGVTLGVSALLVVLAVMNGLQEDLRDKILGATAHLIVLERGMRPFSGYRQILPRVNQVPGVRAAAPFVYAEALVGRKGGSFEGVIVRGVDPTAEGKVTDVSRDVIAGNFLAGAGSEGAIGYILAQRLRVGLGDEVILYSPMAGTLTPLGTVPRMARVRVAGLLKTGLYDYDAKFLYLRLDDAQRFLGLGDEVHGIAARVEDIYRAPAIGRQVADVLGSPFVANDWIAMNHSLFAALRLEKTAMFVILTLIILVAAFAIVAVLVMMVSERTKEIGILRSMGMRAAAIRRIFVAAGAAVGILGTALGCLLGWGMAHVLGTYRLIALPADVYWIDTLPVRMEGTDVALVAAASLLIALLATIYPSRQAARLLPAEALRYE